MDNRISFNKKYFLSLPSDIAEVEKREQVKEYIINNMLTTSQAVALDAVKWFLYGGRASGRTYTACMAAILKVMEFPNIEFEILDHTKMSHHGYHQGYQIDMLYKIIEAIPFLSVEDFTFNQTRMTLKYNKANE